MGAGLATKGSTDYEYRGGAEVRAKLRAFIDDPATGATAASAAVYRGASSGAVATLSVLRPSALA